MIFGYLILAHLLGDFVFQSKKLAKWKIKSKKGLFIHVLAHFLITLAILSPFLLNGQFWTINTAFAISFLHFLIDQSKISYNLRHKRRILSFIIDQILHLTAIFLIYFLIKDKLMDLSKTGYLAIYADFRVVISIIALLILSTGIRIKRFI